VNPETLKETTAPSLDVVAEIDAACDRFESEWQAGRRPRMEAYLAAASERARGGLLAELLRVEIAHRAAQGETLLPQDYTPRFPEHASMIDTLLARGQAAPPAHPTEAGRYRIEGLLASGGMGLVYRAHDPDFGRPLAVKVLREELKDQPALVARFLEEARITGQLQHPGVPPVHEIGRLPDGRPFLAMKLIEGRTLADLLAAPRDPADGVARLLPVFEQVCQTLAYAHDRGVIHRDLKPANVMVGAFGEVQVMDWGLAKSVRSPADKYDEARADPTPAERLLSPHETRSGPTVPGAVMGTLAFMPPEQARGEVDRLDERSDVFGLGAILCVLLTDQPPYRERAHSKLLEQAQTADLADAFSRLERCGTDPELVKLAMRCLAKEPADRPRHAAAVAEEVAAYQEGVRERLRQAQVERARAEVAVREERKRRRMLLIAGGIIAVVLLVGLSASLWQMRRAVQAEGAASASAEQARLSAEEAKRNARQARNERDAKAAALAGEQAARRDETRARERAFEALRSMTADVVERKFTQGAVLTEDDRAFLKGVIAQFDAFAAIKGDDPDSLALRAEGRLRVGHVRSILGQLKEAEKDLDQALSIFKQLVAGSRNRPEFREYLAQCHNDRGVLLSATGRRKEAEEDYDQAVNIGKNLVADCPTRPEFRHDLARSYNNRGILRRAMERPKEAEEDDGRAIDIKRQLVSDFPARPDFREELANSLNNRGVLLRATGRFKAAEKDYEDALRIRKQLTVEFPSRPEYQNELAGSYHNRANLLYATGRPKDAEEDYDGAVRIRKQLVADFPARPGFRQDLAKSQGNRGNLLYATGRPKDAEEDYDQVLSIYRRLAADFPTHPAFRQELAIGYLNRGALLSRTRRLNDAATDFDRAVSIYKRLVIDFPTRPEFRLELAASHHSRGALLHTMGRPKEADEDYREALNVLTRLAADFPTRPELRQELAQSQNNRGIFLGEIGRRKEAKEAFEQALGIQKRLAADFPSRSELRRELAHTHNNLGYLRLGMGRFQDAEQDFNQALEVQKQLMAGFPARRAYREDLALSHTNRGTLLLTTGRVKQAEKEYDLAFGIRKQLAADFPNEADLRNDLAGSCVNLTLVYQQQRNWAAAKRLLLEDRPHHLAALKANPSQVAYRQSYRSHLSVLTRVHAGLLEHQDAVRTAATRRDVGWNAPADAYDAAAFLSKCIPIVAKHDKLDAKQRTETAQFYGDAAMKLLRDAVSKGYRGVAHMKTDTALDPLRRRDDFKKLMAELERRDK
jgi:tetratricopeptide (TPR) repeat protein